MTFMNERDEITEQALSEWTEAGRRGDAEAAFRLAGYYVERRHREGAVEWMALAARLGGSAMLWRLADLVKEDPSGRAAARWQQQAIAAEWGGRDVVVDENTCRISSVGPGAYRTQQFGAHVRGEPDEAVRSTLAAAALRLMCVDENGVEYPDVESVADATAYTPNYISAPEQHPDGGWQFWMDCKGEVYPLMAATHLRILVDELRAAGITGIRIGPRSRPSESVG